MKHITCYLDFVSPYAWLALEQIYRLSAAYPIAVVGLALWLAGGRRQGAVEVGV